MEFKHKDNANIPDRRKHHRRSTIADRRVDIRFEPGKENRRQGTGRRKTDNDIWHHHEE